MDDWRANLKRNWLYMVTGTLLSVFLWVAVSADTVSQETISADLVIIPTDPDYVLTEVEPAIRSVSVVFTGRAVDLASLLVTRPQIVVQIDSVTSPVRNIEFTPAMVKGSDGRALVDVRALSVSPNRVRLHFQPRAQKVVPVSPRLRIDLAQGYVLSDSVRVDPPAVAVSGPQSAVADIDSVATTPIVREDLRESTSVEVMLEQPDPGSQVTLSSSSVRLTLSVEPEGQQVFRGIPVRVGGVDASVVRVEPSLVDIRITGPQSAVSAIRPETLSPRIELSGSRDFNRLLPINLSNLGPFVNVVIEPDSARAVPVSDSVEG